MDQNRFFKWVWRLNALALLLILCSAAWLILGEAIKGFYDTKAEKTQYNNIVMDEEVNASSEIKTTMDIGISIQADDLSLVYFEINKSQHETKYVAGMGSGSGSYDGRSQSLVNYRFLNLKTHEIYDLFETHTKLITKKEELFKHTKNDGVVETVHQALLFTVIEDDSNADGEINSADRASIYISDTSGKHVTKLIGDIKRVLNTQHLNSRYTITYQNSAGFYVQVIDKDSRKISEPVQVNLADDLQSAE